MQNQPPNFIRVDPGQRAMQTLIKVITGFRAAAIGFTVPTVSPPTADQRFSQFFFPKKPVHYLPAHDSATYWLRWSLLPVRSRNSKQIKNDLYVNITKKKQIYRCRRQTRLPDNEEGDRGNIAAREEGEVQTIGFKIGARIYCTTWGI